MTVGALFMFGESFEGHDGHCCHRWPYYVTYVRLLKVSMEYENVFS
jgi:hypothetical protein